MDSKKEVQHVYLVGAKSLGAYGGYVNAKFLNELEEKLHFKSDKRIKFVGTVYDQELLKKIRENAYDKKINIALVMVSSGILIFTTVLWEGFGVPLSSLFGYDSVLVVIQSIGLFVLFNSMNIENKLDQVLSEIGEKSFGIYLIHMVIINLAYKLFKFNPFNANSL